MTLMENSILIRFLVSCWRGLLDAWDQSSVRQVFLRIGAWIQQAVQGSAICQFFWREGTLSRCWQDSLSCALFSALLNLPCVFVRWLYRMAKPLWDGSLLFRGLSAVSSVSFVPLGLFMFVMLIVPHDYWNNAYGFVGAVAVTLLFVLGSAVKPDRRLDGTAFGPYMLFFLLCVFYGLVSSLSTSLSIRFFLFHAASFLLALMAVSTVERLSQLRLMVALVVAGITVAAIYGCYQGYVGVEVVASQQDAILNKGMPGRIYSFFDNPNNFAELLTMLIPLDLGLLFSAKGWRQRLAALAVLVPCLASIGMTLSRSGWIGLALAVCVFIALMNWRLVPVMLVLGFLAIPFLPSTIYRRLLTIGNMKDTSTLYRIAIYKATANLMDDYWLRGVGLGTDVLKRAFANYPTMFDGNSPIHTHNNYLEVWCEMGLAGFLSYLALLFHSMKTGVRQFFHTKNRRLRCMLASAIGAFCGISVISFAEYTWFYPRNMFTYWLLFGIILSCVKLIRNDSSQEG